MVAHTFIGLCTVIFERGLADLSLREGGVLRSAECMCKQSGGT